jgi:lipopolysaccharide assembly outer membrane protein LptD (OstA)
MLRRITIVAIFIMFNAFNAFAEADNAAELLGWFRDPKSCDLCGGSYQDSDNIKENQNPAAVGSVPLNITSTRNALITQAGMSTISGNVTLVQPGREISADTVIFFRDAKTGKITESVLTGHVRFHEYGKLIVAEKSKLNFITEIHTLNNGYYRLLAQTPSGITNIWGKTKHTIKNAAGVLKMRKATYTACPQITSVGTYGAIS